MLGRFVSADTIVPNPTNPQSYNRFSYSYNNPLRYTDPSGHCSGDQNDPDNPDADCWAQINLIQTTFTNITVDPKRWKTAELQILFEALQGIYVMFGSDIEVFKFAFGEITFHRRGDGKISGQYAHSNGHISIYDPAFSSNDNALFTIVHELGHAFDYAATYRYGIKSWFVPPKSIDFVNAVWNQPACTPLLGACWAKLGSVPSGTYATTHAKDASAEDFAETFAVDVFNENTWDLPDGVDQPDQTRMDIVKKWIALTVQNTPRK